MEDAGAAPLHHRVPQGLYRPRSRPLGVCPGPCRVPLKCVQADVASPDMMSPVCAAHAPPRAGGRRCQRVTVPRVRRRRSAWRPAPPRRRARSRAFLSLSLSISPSLSLPLSISLTHTPPPLTTRPFRHRFSMYDIIDAHELIGRPPSPSCPSPTVAPTHVPTARPAPRAADAWRLRDGFATTASGAAATGAEGRAGGREEGAQRGVSGHSIGTS